MIGYFPGYRDGRGHWVIARSRCCGLGLMRFSQDFNMFVRWEGFENKPNEIFCSSCNVLVWKKE